MSDDINITIRDAQPIDITIEDAQPIYLTVTSQMGGSTDIFSNPPSGCYRITNMWINASHEVVIEYRGTVES